MLSPHEIFFLSIEINAHVPHYYASSSGHDRKKPSSYYSFPPATARLRWGAEGYELLGSSGRSRSEWSASIIVAIGGSVSPYSIVELSAYGPRQFGSPPGHCPLITSVGDSLSNGLSTELRMSSCAQSDRQCHAAQQDARVTCCSSR